MRYARGRRLTAAAKALSNGAPDILSVALDAGTVRIRLYTRISRRVRCHARNEAAVDFGYCTAQSTCRTFLRYEALPPGVRKTVVVSCGVAAPGWRFQLRSSQRLAGSSLGGFGEIGRL